MSKSKNEISKEVNEAMEKAEMSNEVVIERRKFTDKVKDGANAAKEAVKSKKGKIVAGILAGLALAGTAVGIGVYKHNKNKQEAEAEDLQTEDEIDDDCFQEF